MPASGHGQPEPPADSDRRLGLGRDCPASQAVPVPGRRRPRSRTVSAPAGGAAPAARRCRRRRGCRPAQSRFRVNGRPSGRGRCGLSLSPRNHFSILSRSGPPSGPKGRGWWARPGPGSTAAVTAVEGVVSAGISSIDQHVGRNAKDDHKSFHPQYELRWPPSDSKANNAYERFNSCF